MDATPKEVLWDSDLIEDRIVALLAASCNASEKASRASEDAIGRETPRGMKAHDFGRLSTLAALQAITLAIVRLEHTLSAALVRWEPVPFADDAISRTGNPERLPPEKTASGN